ncbi:hypothetical protein OIU34_15975 [Pararhizobium sp. BT-229]|uniref:hypothetical protein n=1 Tax=Pararhizobium sp. BT-229 TaxID=2986923 RepID=UPI0021F78742|nr:hypothetical protein [Pararhizobium sp. BT-229]MCV9963402.1 hypothetical protein [Pararhizobium sp. BT-229]
MKIGDSISNYYRPQTSSSGGADSGLSLNIDGGGGQRTQAPTVSISGSASSSSLSSALWLSLADKLESDTGSISEAPTGNSVADEFMEWANMSLAEKIRAQLLADKDLTEEDLAAMDADARAAIEAEIKEAIKRQLEIPEDGGTAQAEAASGGTI